ncbi:hypothetical protein B0H13DRAFT_2674361 [Mycena leptocephala]|nr:hypothetical protein B0H13DRAFT_2674361 [Mycena leptocephala]
MLTDPSSVLNFQWQGSTKKTSLIAEHRHAPPHRLLLPAFIDPSPSPPIPSQLAPTTMTDRVREKLVQLRAEVDAAIERAETAEKKNKDLEQTVLERDHEVKSLGVRFDAEDALKKSEAALKETMAKCVAFFFISSSVFRPSLPCP